MLTVAFKLLWQGPLSLHKNAECCHADCRIFVTMLCCYDGPLYRNHVYCKKRHFWCTVKMQKSTFISSFPLLLVSCQGQSQFNKLAILQTKNQIVSLEESQFNCDYYVLAQFGSKAGAILVDHKGDGQFNFAKLSCFLLKRCQD